MQKQIITKQSIQNTPQLSLCFFSEPKAYDEVEHGGDNLQAEHGR